MSIFEIYFIIVFIINTSLGIGVFFTNHKRTVNQLYLCLSAIIVIWLSSNWLILHAHEEAVATFFVKLATATAILIPAACHILRLAIFYPQDNWLQTILRAKRLLSGCLVIILLCFTPFFIDSVKMPSGEASSPSVPEPIYNWGYFVFAIIFFSGIQILFLGFIGEYIGKILKTVNKDHQYIIECIFKNQNLQK